MLPGTANLRYLMRAWPQRFFTAVVRAERRPENFFAGGTALNFHYKSSGGWPLSSRQNVAKAEQQALGLIRDSRGTARRRTARGDPRREGDGSFLQTTDAG